MGDAMLRQRLIDRARPHPTQADMGARHHRQGPGKAPAIAMEHGQRPQQHGMARHSRPPAHCCQLATAMCLAGELPRGAVCCGRCPCSIAMAGAGPGAFCQRHGALFCLRWVRQTRFMKRWRSMAVTYLCGAPIVMSTLLNAGEEGKTTFPSASASWSPPPHRPKRRWRRWTRPDSKWCMSTG